MSTNERKLGRDRPIALASVKISMADTAANELDQALSREKILGLLDGEIVTNGKRVVRLLNDRRLLCLWDNKLSRHG